MSAPHRFEVRVYYEDTDFSGNVYHAAYLKFCERARTEYLRANGVHHTELAAEGLAFAVRSLSIDYERAARIDDMLAVESRVVAGSGARVSIEQIVMRGGDVVARVVVQVVAITLDGRAARMPKAVRVLYPRV
jgi:acyl-CoA thioester hydrolase